MSEFKNPAEICRERGWKGREGDEPGTLVEGPFGYKREIVFVGRDYIATETIDECHHSPQLWPVGLDISAWTKAEPPPVVTIEPWHYGELWVKVDGVSVARAFPFAAEAPGVTSDDAAAIVRAGAEAMKAKVEELLGLKGKGEDNLWTIEERPRDGARTSEFVIDRRRSSHLAAHITETDGDPIPGLDVAESNKFLRKHLGNLVAELNHIHARQSKQS